MSITIQNSKSILNGWKITMEPSALQPGLHRVVATDPNNNTPSTRYNIVDGGTDKLCIHMLCRMEEIAKNNVVDPNYEMGSMMARAIGINKRSSLVLTAAGENLLNILVAPAYFDTNTCTIRNPSKPPKGYGASTPVKGQGSSNVPNRCSNMSFQWGASIRGHEVIVTLNGNGMTIIDNASAKDAQKACFNLKVAAKKSESETLHALAAMPSKWFTDEGIKFHNDLQQGTNTCHCFLFGGVDLYVPTDEELEYGDSFGIGNGSTKKKKEWVPDVPKPGLDLMKSIHDICDRSRL